MIFMTNLMPFSKVDAMVDLRKLVDGWDIEAFPWSAS